MPGVGRRVLLLGSTGQVGSELAKLLPALGETVSLSRRDLDLSGPDEDIMRVVRETSPHVIVSAAAYTAVDAAESEPDLARRVNAGAVRTLAEAAHREGALLVHYSTDYVFDGLARSPYAEDSPAAPLSVYGRTKLEGEQAVRASGSGHLLLRTSWVYGTTGHNFLLTMLRLGAERGELAVVDDQVGAPTWSRDLAAATTEMIRQLLEHGRAPRVTCHLASSGTASWHGFASAIFRRAAAEGRRVPVLRATDTASYGAPAARPPYSVLDCSRARVRFGVQLPPWQDSLEKVMDELLGRT